MVDMTGGHFYGKSKFAIGTKKGTIITYLIEPCHLIAVVTKLFAIPEFALLSWNVLTNLKGASNLLLFFHNHEFHS